MLIRWAVALAFMPVIFLPVRAQADVLTELGDAAILAQLAPACGIHDKQWGNDLLQSDSGAIQAVYPSTGFPDDATITKWQTAQAVVGAGYVAGLKIFKIYGKAACGVFAGPADISSAETMVTDFRQNDPKQIVDPKEPGGIPNGALDIAWVLSRSDLALACQIKSEDWGDSASTATIIPLSKAAYGGQQLSDDDKNKAFNEAMAAYKFDQTVAATEFSSSLPGCKNVKGSQELKQLDGYIKAEKANPDPWAGAGGY
jgi:hypothetical protein